MSSASDPDTLTCLGNRTMPPTLGISIRTPRNKLREYSDSGFHPQSWRQRVAEKMAVRSGPPSGKK
jgi:hypothetical protein